MNRLRNASENLIMAIENIEEMTTEHEDKITTQQNIFFAQIYCLIEDALAEVDDYINNQ